MCGPISYCCGSCRHALPAEPAQVPAAMEAMIGPCRLDDSARQDRNLLIRGEDCLRLLAASGLPSLDGQGAELP